MNTHTTLGVMTALLLPGSTRLCALGEVSSKVEALMGSLIVLTSLLWREKKTKIIYVKSLAQDQAHSRHSTNVTL